MRLINVRTLEMRFFMERQVPQYAILSHRWGDEEISFQDYQKSPRPDTAGFRKVKDFCQFLKQSDKADYVEWAWIDTCCIDKTSSAELSETINSMYRYYSMALFCVTYLADVHTRRCTSSCDPLCNQCEMVCEEFENSEYWERGWTLQELVASEFLLFVNCDWEYIGQKGTDDLKLLDRINKVTNIPVEVLDDADEAPFQTIAQRLSWAANRITTRVEDEAYCLFGLLGVNLPLLYGEGRGAWKRLMEELIRSSNDESIFASASMHNDLLPPSVAGFAFAFTVQRHFITTRNSYRVTNQGLELKLDAGSAMACIFRDERRRQDLHLRAVPLNCRMEDPDFGLQPIFLLLRKYEHCGHYAKFNSDQMKAGRPILRSPAWTLCEEEVICVHMWYEEASNCLAQEPDKAGSREPTTSLADSFAVWRKAIEHALDEAE